MKNKISILFFCMLLISYVVPISAMNIDYKYTVLNQIPVEKYRLDVKSLDDGRDAPFPGDISGDIVFPKIINDFPKIPIPPKKQLGLNNETIIEILIQIDETLVLGYLENLTAFGPRVTGTPECAEAGDYIYNEFLDLGLEARYDDWSYGGYSDRNIEGTLQGTNKTSDEIYIICAHYDSVPGSPGADDDGSGTAAVLASANIMSQYQFNHTIRFVAFSGEEQGLLGSYKYVEEALADGDNIIAALNADMIGFSITENDGKNIKVYENDASEWITDFTILISEDYYNYIELTIIPSGYSYGSDHYSFWEFGYDAIFYHEYNFNDYYHSPQDTIENMNITYSTKSTKLITATLGELAKAFLIGNPPENPNPPDGPTEGIEGQELIFSASTIDPDGDQIYYKFDWGDGIYSDWFGPNNSGETIEISNIWYQTGIFEVRVKAKDINNRLSNWSEPLVLTINENLPPSETTINGPRIGRTGKPLTFSFISTDPEEHDVFYYVMWGDGTSNDWNGPYKSGDEISIDHTYSKGGRLFMNAKAKDQYGQEGETVHFVLFIIKNRSISNPYLIRYLEHLIERFPILKIILNTYL